MAHKKKKIRLTRRDYAILRDARDYGLVVPEFLLAQRFPGRQLDAVKSTLRRLYGRGPNYLYLRPERLDTKRVYYRLTSRGCRLIGASRDASRPFGRKAVALRYATLWFICVEKPKTRRLVDPREFSQIFPGDGGAITEAAVLYRGSRRPVDARRIVRDRSANGRATARASDVATTCQTGQPRALARLPLLPGGSFFAC